MLSTEAKLTDLVARMKEFAGENLESVVLYGSAARGDFKEGHSDLNVLCVLRSVATRELTRVAPSCTGGAGTRTNRPRCFSPPKMRQSADVFPSSCSTYSRVAVFSMVLMLWPASSCQ